MVHVFLYIVYKHTRYASGPEYPNKNHQNTGKKIKLARIIEKKKTK